MGAALADLERVLASKRDLTRVEANVLFACKARAVKDFTVGACVGSGVVWAATRRFLTRWQSLNCTAGAAVLFGLWRFGKSLDSSVDTILAFEGSRMQKELASIIVKKYQDNPGKMQQISKHFYSEEVFDDTTLDRPKLRWRYRNFFNESSGHGQSTSEAANETGSSESRFHQNPQNKPQNSASNHHNPRIEDIDETKSEVRRSPVNPGVHLMGDPLECVFGQSTLIEEAHYTNSSSVSPKVPLSRSHKRSHRRRRRHQEVQST